ncbi:MAG: diaminopimelate decarboxylase [Microbacteriaceae bacterium]
MNNPLAPKWLTPPGDANVLAPGVWPHTAHRGENGDIEIGGVSVTELAREFGTPLYVYDEADVRGRARRIRESFDAACEAAGTHGHVYYASKAFSSAGVLRWMIDAGLRVDVATEGELELALAAGVPASSLGVHGNNKSDREIERAVTIGAGSLVIDSFDEIDRVADIAERAGVVQNVRLRANTGVHASTHDHLATAREDQKFGVALRDVPTLVAAIRSRTSLRFLGLHSHIGSQIFGSSGFVEAARRLLDVHTELLAGGDVPELNLGGGFGIAYTSVDSPTDAADLAGELVDAVARICAEKGIAVPALAIEPGRSVVGPGGITLYTTGTIKPIDVIDDHGNAGTRTYVSVDGGMSDNMRTALYHADYSVALAGRSSDAEPALVRVVGKHCESGDIVVRTDYLPGDVHRGDLLAVPATGAYCASLSNPYNQITRPAVVAVHNGEATLLVRRETVADLFSRDTQLESGN